MVASAGMSYQGMAGLQPTSDDDLEAVLWSSGLDLDLPSFAESSTDTSSPNSSALFDSTAASLDPTEDMYAPPMSTAFAEDSMRSFDWSNWEDLMQWDDNSIAVESLALPMSNPPTSHVNPSLTSTADGVESSSSCKSSDIRSSLGSIDFSTFPTSPFTFTGSSFECGMSKPLLTFDDELRLSVDLTEPSTGEFPNPNSLNLDQFQFGGALDDCPSFPVQQPPVHNLALETFSLSGNSTSPTTDSRRSMSMSSPESSLSSQSRKRKSSSDDEDVDSAPTKLKRVLGPKEAHKVVEKKYRMNLNDKISALRDSIPSFQQAHKGSPDDPDSRNLDAESRQAGKPNKGLVLSKATEYIRNLERRNRKLNKEMAILKMQLHAFKTLVMARQAELSGDPIEDPNTARGINTNGIRQPYQAQVQAVTQGHSLGQTARPVGRQGSAGSGGGYMSKLMVGSLAGFMIIQGFSEKEQAEETPAGRGLFALPTELLSRMRYVVHSVHQSHAIGYMSSLERPLFLFKAVLLIGAIMYLISPSFFDVKPREKANPAANLALTAAPPLAAPVEVRRNAWLTAVQTVWVPRQSVLLQIVALVLKSVKLLLRNAIGWHGYAILTGATEEQEGARVKAWEIALDAQIAGGDEEISMSRLVLTMIASGTLPETPYRLMRRALHLQILLREAAHSRWGGWLLYGSLAAKLARHQWERARKLQKQVNGLPPSNEASASDTLPDYLAHLLELDCDAIMVDAIVQRAYNLTWNRPTADRVVQYVDAMDSIIDDPAIRSPLDALAAWYSCFLLHAVLTLSLEASTRDADPTPAIRDGLDIALKIAPPGSRVQGRSLAARAVLLGVGRGPHIAAALQALSLRTSQPVGLESGSCGSLIALLPGDPALAIRCGMAIALLKRPRSSAAAIAFCGHVRSSHESMGLLGFTAMYHFLAAAFQDKNVADEIRDILEDVAGTLKIWIGRKESENSGLEKEAMSNVATLCVNVFNWLVGRSGDCSDGQVYSMASDKEGACEVAK